MNPFTRQVLRLYVNLVGLALVIVLSIGILVGPIALAFTDSVWWLLLWVFLPIVWTAIGELIDVISDVDGKLK